MLHWQWGSTKRALWREVGRLIGAAAEPGVQRVIHFGLLMWGKRPDERPRLALKDILLDFLECMTELHRRLHQPQVSADLLVYTQGEMARVI